MDIGELLAFGVKNGASDMHLSAGMPPMIRVDGDMRKIDIPPMDNTAVRDLVYDIMNDKQQKEFEEFLECDFSFEIPGLARFRVNALNQNRGAGAVFRTNKKGRIFSPRSWVPSPGSPPSSDARPSETR